MRDISYVNDFEEIRDIGVTCLICIIRNIRDFKYINDFKDVKNLKDISKVKDIRDAKNIW